MRTLRAALDSLIATAGGAVAIVVFLPVLLLATGVKMLLPAREGRGSLAPDRSPR